MVLWARKFCVAMLALALLVAPCLSTVDIFKTGPAHAHHASHVGHEVDARTTNPDRHSTDAGHAHGHDHAKMVSAGDQPVSPDRDLASCCRLCDGWLTKTGNDQKAIEGTAPAPERESGRIIHAVLVVTPAVRPPDRLCGHRVAVDLPAFAALPVYALTRRLRI